MAVAYDDEFYSIQRIGSESSARVVLPLMFELVKPSSVVDVGCGVGTWLAVAADLGAAVTGFEGEWVKSARLAKPGLNIQFRDLEKRVSAPTRSDMAICLEVAEHLSADRGPSLIEDLCSLANVVLFSAAIPRQGGTEHINERWQSYWAAEFKKHAYIAYDVVRPVVWEDDRVEWWYRQNALVYANSAAAHLFSAYRPCDMLDAVHRELWEYPVALRYVVKQFPGAVQRAVKKKLVARHQ